MTCLDLFSEETPCGSILINIGDHSVFAFRVVTFTGDSTAYLYLSVSGMCIAKAMIFDPHWCEVGIDFNHLKVQTNG